MQIYKKFKLVFGKNFNQTNVVIFGLSFFQIIIELFSIALLVPLVHYLTDNTSISNYPEIVLIFFDLFIINKSISQILIFLIILYGIKSILLIFINNALLSASKSLQYHLANDLLNGYITSSVISLNNKNSSYFLRNIYSETGDVVSRYFQFINLVLETLILFSILILSFVINFLFTILVLVIFLSFAFCYFFFLKDYVSNLGKEKLDTSAYKLKTINELFDNFSFIKLTNKFPVFINYYNKVNSIFLSSMKKIALIDRLPRFFFEPALIFLLLINYFSSILMKLSNTEILQNLLIFLVLSLRIIPSVNRILASLNKLRFGTFTINTIYNEIKNFKSREKKIKKKSIKVFNFENLIFDKISFSFNKKDFVFKDLNLKINKNDNIGIVGPSGSGKTTFLNLLLGFYPPLNGKIVLDNSNLSNMKYDWQKSIGYVPQKTLLLDESVLFNITLDNNSNFKKNLSLKKIYDICCLKDFVSFGNLEKKIIGERGSKISGGQAQRISIARALYINPSILILDEPSANLDQITAKKILNKLKKFYQDKCIVVVTHNKNDLLICNKVFKVVNKKLKKL